MKHCKNKKTLDYDLFSSDNYSNNKLIDPNKPVEYFRGCPFTEYIEIGGFSQNQKNINILDEFPRIRLVKNTQKVFLYHAANNGEIKLCLSSHDFEGNCFDTQYFSLGEQKSLEKTLIEKGDFKRI